MLKKILTTIFGLSIGAGFLLVIGTDRAPGVDPIDFKTFLVQCGIGLLFIAVGIIGLKAMGCKHYE